MGYNLGSEARKESPKSPNGIGIYPHSERSRLSTRPWIAENSHRPIRDVLEEKLSEALLAEHESSTESNDPMDIEMAAYERMHPNLVNQYLGEFVAITDEILVDHDLNPNTLMQRLRSKYPKTKVIHVTKVRPTIQRTIIVRSPKLTRIEE